MAQVTEVRLVDDLDGGDADESVDFTVDNKRYQMDLSEKNAARLREILAPFIAAARRSSGATTPAPAAAPPQPAPPARVRKPRPSGNGQVRTDSRSPHEAGSPPLCVRPTRTGPPRLPLWLSRRRPSRPTPSRSAGHARRSPTHSPPSKHTDPPPREGPKLRLWPFAMRSTDAGRGPPQTPR